MPEVGRFVTRDPCVGFVQNPQSSNRYAYCENNPVSCTDPLGLWGADVHRDMTLWAASKLSFTAGERRLMAEANYWFDYVCVAVLSPPLHFDVIFFSPEDTRRQFAEVMLDCAISYARQGDKKAAMICLGCGLHSLQDIYAHVGFGWFHILPGCRWDDPSWRPQRFVNAKRASVKYLWGYLAAVD